MVWLELTASSCALLSTSILLVCCAVWSQRRRIQRRTPRREVRILAVLGSGGHTAEMLRLLPPLCANKAYSHIDFVLAETDRSSRTSAERLCDELAQRGSAFPPICFHLIPRSREVGQSYASSVFTTLRATAFAARTVLDRRPDLVLCNGPGTCLPICLIAWLLTLLTLQNIKIVYVESVARVVSLSLTGRIICTLRLADEFLVQWPQLASRNPGTRYLGRTC